MKNSQHKSKLILLWHYFGVCILQITLHIIAMSMTKQFCFLKMRHFRPLFLYFCLFDTVDSYWYYKFDNDWTRTSDVVTTCSMNWATATAQSSLFFDRTTFSVAGDQNSVVALTKRAFEARIRLFILFSCPQVRSLKSWNAVR